MSCSVVLAKHRGSQPAEITQLNFRSASNTPTRTSTAALAPQPNFATEPSGKTHISAAIGRALVDNGYRVLFTRTAELVQRLQTARQDLALEASITRPDRYDLLVLDDLSYVRGDQAVTSVLFELIGKRHERRSMLITANQPFAEWNKVFPDPSMTIAAVDRLVHHSVVVGMNVESYRQKTATSRNRARATIKSDNQSATAEPE